MTPSRPTTSVLFVCLGNICRSPLAEGVFRHLARERGLDDTLRIESAGTGSWHVGNPPDPRSVEVAARHGIRLESRARVVVPEDAERFDLILAMDRANLADLAALFGAGGGRLRLFRDFDPEGEDGDLDVPDPYYGGAEGFNRVYTMVHRTASALLDHLPTPSSGGTRNNLTP